MVKYVYSPQFYGVVVTLLLCSVTYRTAALAILIGGFGSVVTLLCIAARSSFPEVEGGHGPRMLKRQHIPRSDLKSTSWRHSEIVKNHPDVAAKIEELSELLVRDYVTSWFQYVDATGVSGFQEAAKNIILTMVVKIRDLVEQMDETNLLILKLLPLFTKHLEVFRLAKQAVDEDESLAGDLQNAQLQLVVKYNKVCKLHQSLSLRPSFLERDVELYMTAKVEKLLPLLMDEMELSSPFVFTLLRDVLANCVLKPIVTKLSDADFWNSSMISISDGVLEEQEQVTQIRKFLSKEVEVQNGDVPTDANSNGVTQVDQELVPGINGAQFELYLRQISQLNRLENLQRERFLIITKLLTFRNDKKASDSPEYEKRLLLSLNLLQTRLRCVNPKCSTSKRYRMTMDLSDAMKVVDEFEGFLETLKLNDVLQEPKCSVFFERYLTMKLYRRGACYLSFWKLTENMKNPLENAHDDMIVTISPWEIAQLRDAASEFFRNEHLEFMNILDPGLVTNVLLFIRDVGGDASRTFPLAKRSILLLQSEAQRAMENDFFKGFKSSSLFLDMLASVDFTSTELYARLVVDSQTSEALTTVRGKEYLGSFRAYTNPGIENALEDILNKDKSQRRRAYSQKLNQEDRKDKPLEVSDINLYNDALFEDDDEDEEMISVRRRKLSGNKLMDSHPIGSEFDGELLLKFAHLKDKIARLTVSLDQIERQLELLNHLILKAELTNNQKQLKLLLKSQRALMRDLDSKELLKQQLIVCQNANSLYKKTRIAIKSHFVDNSHEEGGVIYYLITVDLINNNQVATWTVPRRFSEFVRLHNYLKSKYKNLMKNVTHKEAFPRKVKISLILQNSKGQLCRERTVKLERYIRELLKIPVICQDDQLRAFLIDSSAFTESLMTAPLIKRRETGESSGAEGTICSSSSDRAQQKNSSGRASAWDISDENDELSSSFEDERISIESYESQLNPQNRPFVKAICDAFISLFSLNKTNTGWLRGRAIVTILQQLMGNAIERYIKDAMTKVTSEAQISGFLTQLRLKMWDSNGNRNRKETRQRKANELKKTRTESQLLLKCLFTEVCGKVVGFKNAQQAAMQLHEMLQNSYLTANLMLEILDMAFDELLSCSKH